MKDNHFKLSTSFTNLFAKKDQTSQHKQQTTKSLDKGLFKLNPKSAHTLEDVPVQILKKKSKNKLQSLKDQTSKQKWSIFTQKMDPKDVTKEKKVIPKKYHLDINAQINKKQNKNASQSMQAQLPHDIVRPSRLDQLNKNSTTDTNCSLFQTPLLPCFSSQFRHNMDQVTTQFKAVQQKQGVWKIGKIKMKGKTATLNIGGIQFEAVRADVSGKAGIVSGDNFFELNNWKYIWVVQPSQQLFK